MLDDGAISNEMRFTRGYMNEIFMNTDRLDAHAVYTMQYMRLSCYEEENCWDFCQKALGFCVYFEVIFH